MHFVIKQLFLKQKSHIDAFYEALDMQAAESFFELLAEVKGVLFFTGVGKSGFVAQKIASTMMSTGSKALFLDPLGALHGDLGLVEAGDVVIFLSKSGQTDELFQLLTPIRAKGAKIAAICCNAKSRLIEEADYSLVLPCQSELCPFDLAPTSSAIVQLLLGDVLTVALMHKKNFSLRQYAENHPHGRIGRRATLKVKDLMLDFHQTPFCGPDALLEEVLGEFTNKRCGCLVVIDKQKRLQGIFTDGDLRRALQKKGEKVLKDKVVSLMTPSPKSIHEDALAWDAVKLMEADANHPIMVLPVLTKECKEVVGIIKMHDLIQADI